MTGWVCRGVLWVDDECWMDGCAWTDWVGTVVGQLMSGGFLFGIQNTLTASKKK